MLIVISFVMATQADSIYFSMFSPKIEEIPRFNFFSKTRLQAAQLLINRYCLVFKL